MEIFLLAIQARVLLVVGMTYIVIGLWMGTDPVALAWRAAVAGFAGMVAAGWLLRQVAGVIEERLAADMAERQEAAELAAAQAAQAANPMNQMQAQAQANARAHRTPAGARR
jgi:hypothetical protein